MLSTAARNLFTRQVTQNLLRPACVTSFQKVSFSKYQGKKDVDGLMEMSIDNDSNQKDIIDNYGNFRQENISNTYDNLADRYEAMMLGMGHLDPMHCAEIAQEVLGDNAKDATFLDFGCGSGLIGHELSKLKICREIVGLDASDVMLQEAGKKKIYSELEKCFFGDPDVFPKHHRNRYDALGCTGLLAEGHLTPTCFDEMLLALKKGGYAIFSTRKAYLKKYNYGSKIDLLEETGAWEKVKELEFVKYDKIPQGENIGRFVANDGIIYCYKKL